ncbi:MAG: DNA polymerase III subunit beta [Nitrospinaceae bacterium]|nr:DNA polymerase III subunit beta [Nitrospinaceae bacterium]NIR54393.1 DNA polymerase III subunit beta [Nitrospinaceae bacterium]NIS84807.1 DNA polymerase III subunit beta [Nitrospinaceae bacterium]NIT81612.1 DNA polymerase III subunit beta [Nitrospinaceae bacterium]NIU43895.1 DNA polymerase III subunit beta [Nitrospinaceae bacterium]
MEIKISRDDFLNGMHMVQGVVESKGAMPILAHVLIDADKEGIVIQATDLEIGIKGFFPAKVIAKGAVTVNARKLFDILRELPDLEVHLKKEDNDWVTLKCGKSKFRLPSLPASDFPKLPEYSEEALMEFSGAKLKDMIRKTYFAISPDESRQALNGLLLEQDKDHVNLVGTDGHRLSFVRRPLLKSSGKGDAAGYLLPKKVLTELLKLMESDEGATYAFSVKDNQLAFIHDRQVIVSRKIDGKFPNYQQVIPADNDLKVTVNTQALIHALKRVALLADEKSKMVRFEIQEGTLKLVSDHTELGGADEEVEIPYKGEDVRIGLNARYILDVLNVLDDEEVTLNLKDQNHSCLLTSEADKDYRSIVMPMRL